LLGHALAPVAGALTLWERDTQQQLCDQVVDQQLNWAAMALAANPVCSPATRDRLRVLAATTGDYKLVDLLGREPVQLEGDPLSCDDTDVLSKVLRRALPGRYRPQGRPGQLAYLAQAPLDTTQAQALIDALAASEIPRWALERCCAQLESRVGLDESVASAARGLRAELAGG